VYQLEGLADWVHFSLAMPSAPCGKLISESAAIFLPLIHRLRSSRKNRLDQLEGLADWVHFSLAMPSAPCGKLISESAAIFLPLIHRLFFFSNCENINKSIILQFIVNVLNLLNYVQ